MKNKRDSIQIVQHILPPIISLMIFVVIGLLMATKPGIRHEISEYFWAQTLGAVICLILTFIVWLPTGEHIAWSKAKVQNNKRLYDYRANYIISHQMFSLLNDFTKKKNIDRHEELIRQALADGTGWKHDNGNIDYWVYELFIKKEKTPEEQKRCDEVMAKHTPKQQDLIKKLSTSTIPFKQLTPQDLIMGRSKNKGIVNRDSSKFYELKFISIKSVWGFMSSCFSYFIIISPNSDFGPQQIVMILVWLFTFLSAIYSAIRTGYKAIFIKKNQYNLEQGILCGEFMAFAGVDSIDMNPPEMQQIETK